MTKYYGVDLHMQTLSFHLISKSDDGAVGHSCGTLATAEMEPRFTQHLDKNSYVCVEASSMTFEFVRRIKEKAAGVYIVNPIDCKELYSTGKKTDKIDAKKLAIRLKSHIEDNDPDDDFPIVYYPQQTIIDMRQLVQTYDFLTNDAVSYRNKIRALFRSVMIFVTSKDLRDIHSYIDASAAPAVIKMQARVLVGIYSSCMEQRDQIKEALVALGKQHHAEEVALLMSIKGINELGACMIVADIADISRFKNAKRLSSYLRAAQRVDSSGKSTHIGKTNKRGRRASVRIILQAIEHIKKSNDNMMKFYERIKKGKSKCTVRMAIARKTIVAIFYMLKTKTPYRFTDKNLYGRKLLCAGLSVSYAVA